MKFLLRLLWNETDAIKWLNVVKGSHMGCLKVQLWLKASVASFGGLKQVTSNMNGQCKMSMEPKSDRDGTD